MVAPSANILAWLRPEHIQVAFAGRGWDLHAHTAADWLGAIAMDFDTLSGVFPGLVADEDVEAMSHLVMESGNHAGMQEVARKVVQAAGGRDWWWTVNLARAAVGNWIYYNGFLVRQGVRADSIGLPDWLDACYTWLWERGDENQKAALDANLSLPPRGVRVGKKKIQEMMADFAAD